MPGSSSFSAVTYSFCSSADCRKFPFAPHVRADSRRVPHTVSGIVSCVHSAGSNAIATAGLTGAVGVTGGAGAGPVQHAGRPIATSIWLRSRASRIDQSVPSPTQSRNITLQVRT